VKSLSPVQSLAFLLLLGAAISGWMYGIHWKRVASGDLFTADEKLIIGYQNQINALEEELTELRKRLPDEEAESTASGQSDVPDLPPASQPILPALPQKIETH